MPRNVYPEGVNQPRTPLKRGRSQSGYEAHLPFFLVILVLFLGACRGGSPTAPTPQPAATSTPLVELNPTPTVEEPTSGGDSLRGDVRLWLAWPAGAFRTLVNRIETFQELHPMVQFDLTYYRPEELEGAVRSAVEGGDPPTLFFGPSQRGRGLLEDQLITDLTGHVPSELQADLHPLAWAQVEVGSAVVGLPLFMEGNVLYRNSRLALETGSTVTEWMERVEDMHSQEGVLAALDLGAEHSIPWARACGEDLISPTEPPPLNTPLAVCWLNLLEEIGAAGFITFNAQEDRAMFQDGRSAWYIGGSDEMPGLIETLGEGDLSVDRWPRFASTGYQLTGYVWTENAYLLQGSTPADLQASLRFVQYLLTPESQLALSQWQGGGQVPVLQGVEAISPQVRMLQLALDDGIPLPLWGGAGEYQDILERAVRAVTVQGASVETAQARALEELRLHATEEAPPP